LAKAYEQDSKLNEKQFLVSLFFPPNPTATSSSDKQQQLYRQLVEGSDSIL
jgi:hypothetical protein